MNKKGTPWYKQIKVKNASIYSLDLSYATLKALNRHPIYTVGKLREMYFNKRVCWVKGIGSARYHEIYYALCKRKREVKTLGLYVK